MSYGIIKYEVVKIFFLLTPNPGIIYTILARLPCIMEVRNEKNEMSYGMKKYGMKYNIYVGIMNFLFCLYLYLC